MNAQTCTGSDCALAFAVLGMGRMALYMPGKGPVTGLCL